MTLFIITHTWKTDGDVLGFITRTNIEDAEFMLRQLRSTAHEYSRFAMWKMECDKTAARYYPAATKLYGIDAELPPVDESAVKELVIEGTSEIAEGPGM